MVTFPALIDMNPSQSTAVPPPTILSRPLEKQKKKKWQNNLWLSAAPAISSLTLDSLSFGQAKIGQAEMKPNQARANRRPCNCCVRAV